MTQLLIEYIGEQRTVTLGETLTFGRLGDIEIDDNPYLHRVLGRFVAIDDRWTLRNEGRNLDIHLEAEQHGVRNVVAPGNQIFIAHRHFRITFSAGVCKYELTGSVLGSTGSTQRAAATGGVGSTKRFGDISLRGEQRRAVAVMASQYLLGHPTPAPLSNKEIATTCGWTEKATERKIAKVAEKLFDVGVPNVLGSEAGPARSRRVRLVQHAIDARLIGRDDLDLDS